MAPLQGLQRMTWMNRFRLWEWQQGVLVTHLGSATCSCLVCTPAASAVWSPRGNATWKSRFILGGLFVV